MMMCVFFQEKSEIHHHTASMIALWGENHEYLSPSVFHSSRLLSTTVIELPSNRLARSLFYSHQN